MAAPPATPSPSNQAMQQTTVSTMDTNNESKVPPGTFNKSNDATIANDPSSTTGSLQSPPPPPSLVPSYTSSELSENYLLAKQHLNTGNFEDALDILEQELENTKTLLTMASTSTQGTSTITGDTNTGSQQQLQLHPQERIIDADVHPSLAPLHYLYGTTLLYSLEEAKDDNGQDMATMTTILPPQDENDQNQDNNDEGNDHQSAAVNYNPLAHLSESTTVNPDLVPAVADNADDDMEIAWENFEVARHIIETMISQPQFATMETKLKMYVFVIL
jgi:hypothetical protein